MKKELGACHPEPTKSECFDKMFNDQISTTWGFTLGLIGYFTTCAAIGERNRPESNAHPIIISIPTILGISIFSTLTTILVQLQKRNPRTSWRQPWRNLRENTLHPSSNCTCNKRISCGWPQIF